MEYLEVDGSYFDSTHNLSSETTVNHMSRRKRRRAQAALMTGGASLAFGRKKKRKKRGRKSSSENEGQMPSEQQQPLTPETAMPKEVYDEMPDPMKDAMNDPDISNPEMGPDDQGNDDPESDQEFENHVTKVGKFLRKAAKSKVLALATGGLSKLGSKESRQKIGKTLTSIVKNINPLLMPLMPLRPLMRKALAKAGHPVSKKINITDLANQFYQNVVKKSPLNPDKFNDVPDLDSLERDDHVIPIVIGAIVSGILQFIKGIKEKKASGAKLSPLESGIANDTEKVETSLQEKAKAEVGSKVSASVGHALLFDKKTQLIIGGILLAIIVIVFVVARKK